MKSAGRTGLWGEGQEQVISGPRQKGDSDHRWPEKAPIVARGDLSREPNRRIVANERSEARGRGRRTKLEDKRETQKQLRKIKGMGGERRDHKMATS